MPSTAPGSTLAGGRISVVTAAPAPAASAWVALPGTTRTWYVVPSSRPLMSTVVALATGPAASGVATVS